MSAMGKRGKRGEVRGPYLLSLAQLFVWPPGCSFGRVACIHRRARYNQNWGLGYSCPDWALDWNSLTQAGMPGCPTQHPPLDPPLDPCPLTLSSFGKAILVICPGYKNIWLDIFIKTYSSFSPCYKSNVCLFQII